MNTLIYKKLILWLVVIAGTLALTSFLLQRNAVTVVTTYCTADALMCPDGSGVGRQGAQCDFSACPNHDSFTGQFTKDNVGYRLIIISPQNVGMSATYVMPLEFGKTKVDETLLQKTVMVSGKFIEGNRLQVSKISTTGKPADISSLRVGETTLIKGVKITLNKVTGDSRCPIGVQCIWAGNVTANVTLTTDTDMETVDLVLGANPHAIDSFTVSLIRVAPQNLQGQTIPSSEYTLTFQVANL